MPTDKELQEQGIETRKGVYQFLVDFITENGYAPTFSEIAEGTGLKSKSSVYDHLQILEMMGKIHVEKNKQRAISLNGYKFVKVG